MVSRDVHVSVTWSLEPVDWLLPAVRAFKDTANRCHREILPPPPPGDLERVYDISLHITSMRGRSSSEMTSKSITFSCDFSERYSNNTTVVGSTSIRSIICPMHSSESQASVSSPSSPSFTRRRSDLDDSDMRLVALHPSQTVPVRRALETKLGMYLVNRKAFLWIFLVVLVFYQGLKRFNPGAEKVEIPNSLNGTSFQFEKTSPLVQALQISCISWLLYTALHYINVGLLRFTIFRFETWVLAVLYLVRQVTSCYNDFSILHESGDAGIVWTTMEMLRELVQLAITFLTICNTDAVMVTRCWKVVIFSIYALSEVYYFMQVRFDLRQIWLDREVCWWIECTEPRRIFLSATANRIAFVLKITFSLLRYDFACLTTPYGEVSTAFDAAAHLNQSIAQLRQYSPIEPRRQVKSTSDASASEPSFLAPSVNISQTSLAQVSSLSQPSLASKNESRSSMEKSVSFRPPSQFSL